MSMNDPVSDMFTRIRNGQQSAKRVVKMYSSKLKCAIASVLKEEGYIEGFEVVQIGNTSELTITLKYHMGEPVLEMMRRVSRPGLRIYRSSQELPKVNGGLGTAIISTSKGVMTDRAARAAGYGGEVLCVVA
ncbi:MAG: 30S ribosomal protein S8 [Gammaproteobacteria bacterium]|nr:30S ribosomal protein S8 [Gammaproteobacteria bacterium]